MEKKTIAGFHISGTLGEGGMGVVYEAHDATLDRTIALKVLRPSTLGPEGHERFIREARACSRINHPNIVTVYAAGEDNGCPYIAMEVLKGRNLRQIIDDGPVPWDKAIRWVRDILNALSRLHQEGIVHRDLKPDNIILTEDGIVKLMDFGIARIASSSTITQEGTALGTVFYMSPEQVRGEKVDARSDIFAMGGVLYQLLTGKLPFEGEEPLAVMYLIQNESPRPLEEYQLDIPEALIAIVNTALSKDTKSRYADALAFQRALESLLQDEGLATAQLEAAKKKQRILVRAVLPAVVLMAALAVFLVITLVDRAPPIDHDLAVHHNELGQSFEQQGEPLKAEDEYRLSIVADRTYPQPWNNLGVLAFRRNDLDVADSLFTEAITRDSLYVAALVNRGTVRWDLRRLSQAEHDFRLCLRADSSAIECYNNYAALLIEEQRLDESIAILEHGLRRDPRHPYLLKNMGVALSRSGDIERARTCLLQAHDQLPENIEINLLLARWYQEHGSSEEARKYWEVILRSDEDAHRAEARNALQDSEQR